MNVLLDTHSFLWSAFEPGRLSPTARKTITDPENAVYVSAISFWEISLKMALGKLMLDKITPEQLPDTAAQMGHELLPLAPDEAASFHRLPCRGHKDPFDRMLVWQAIRRQMTLISADSALADYTAEGLRLLW